MAWVKENIAEPNQNVRVIIIAKDVDEALAYGIKSTSNVEIKTYKVDLHLKSY